MIKTPRAIGGALLAVAVMGTVSVASATTWNFGGAFANLGPDEVFTVGADSVNGCGLYLHGVRGQWHLYGSHPYAAK